MWGGRSCRIGADLHINNCGAPRINGGVGCRVSGVGRFHCPVSLASIERRGTVVSGFSCQQREPRSRKRLPFPSLHARRLCGSTTHERSRPPKAPRIVLCLHATPPAYLPLVHHARRLFALWGMHCQPDRRHGL